MNTNKNNNDAIDNALGDAYRKIEPPQGWDALRTRIEQKVENAESSGTKESIKEILYWRRLALVMAACFLVTAGTLIYFFSSHHGAQEYEQQIASTDNLLTLTEVNRLSAAFSQVRQLFGQQSQWIMIGSKDDTQLGVVDKPPLTAENNKVIAIRLMTTHNNGLQTSQYFDLVIFSNQQADFQLLFADSSSVKLSVKPILKSNGKIDVEIIATTDTGSQISNINTITDRAFTSLVRMRTNGNLLTINGTGRLISNI